jgi:hypothetical protein
MVLKGPNEMPRKDPEIGILISLLEINSAVTTLVIKSPDKIMNNHVFRSNTIKKREFKINHS